MKAKYKFLRGHNNVNIENVLGSHKRIQNKMALLEVRHESVQRNVKMHFFSKRDVDTGNELGEKKLNASSIRKLKNLCDENVRMKWSPRSMKLPPHVNKQVITNM